MRISQRGSRKMGNQAQLVSVAMKSTSPSRRSVRRKRLRRASGALLASAARTCVSASANPAAKMKDGATSPSIHCSAA